MASGNIHEDLSPRLLPRLVKPTTKRNTDKQFDIRLSRLPRGHGENKVSMLEYTDNVRKINHGRKVKPTHVTQLALRSHHGPKNASPLTMKHRRKGMSLNELLERRKLVNAEKRNTFPTKPLSSVKLSHLPQRHLKISFVSASDLHDILDCNIRSAEEHTENLRLTLLRANASMPWMQGTSREPSFGNLSSNSKLPTPYIQTENKFKSGFPLFQEKLSSNRNERDSSILVSLPSSIKPEDARDTLSIPTERDSPDKVKMVRTILSSSRPSYLRYRPRRAKRMVLHRPDLGVIPEGDGDMDTGTGQARAKAHLPSKSSLDAIKHTRSHLQPIPVQPNNEVSDLTVPGTESLKNPQILPSVESASIPKYEVKELSCKSKVPPITDVRPRPDELIKDTKKQSQTTKVKASLKMNKLIFLRDSHDKYFLRK